MPFSQVDHIEAGTGLGLPLVKRALDALEGTIDVQSNEMLDTNVKVVIPMASLDCVLSLKLVGDKQRSSSSLTKHSRLSEGVREGA